MAFLPDIRRLNYAWVRRLECDNLTSACLHIYRSLKVFVSTILSKVNPMA